MGFWDDPYLVDKIIKGYILPWLLPLLGIILLGRVFKWIDEQELIEEPNPPKVRREHEPLNKWAILFVLVMTLPVIVAHFYERPRYVEHTVTVVEVIYMPHLRTTRLTFRNSNSIRHATLVFDRTPLPDPQLETNCTYRIRHTNTAYSWRVVWIKELS